MRKSWLLLTGLVASVFLIGTFGSKVHATSGTIIVSPSTVSTVPGKTFTLTVSVISDAAVNAASGSVIFPGSLLDVSSISQSGTVFTLWTTNPARSGDSIPFGGGLASPGITGTGKIFSVVFKAKAAGTASVTIANGKVLANDGKGTDIYSGTNTSVVTIGAPAPTLAAAKISSSTHPDQTHWYTARDVSLSWNKPSGATGFDYVLSSDGNASKTGSQTNTDYSVSGLADGAWTFTLKTKYDKGDASSSYKILIDASVPNDFSITVTRKGGNTDPHPSITYTATDATSGIDHYEILLDGKSVATVSTDTYQLPTSLPGQHNLVVKAFDKAGNAKEASATYEIESFAGPIITSWPNYLSALQPIKIIGLARFDATVQLYIGGDKVAEFPVRDHLTEKQQQQPAASDSDTVEWNYTYKGAVYPGKSLIYAYQMINDGVISNRSNEVQTIVLWTFIQIGAYSVSIYALLIVLLILLLLLAILCLLIYRKLKALVKRRRKDRDELVREVNGEMEALDQHLVSHAHKESLNQAIDQDIKVARQAIVNDISKVYGVGKAKDEE